jgi:hypothetical protein
MALGLPCCDRGIVGANVPDLLRSKCLEEGGIDVIGGMFCFEGKEGKRET